MIQRGEELGFETTLIAERWMGTDHSAWMLASAWINRRWFPRFHNPEDTK